MTSPRSRRVALATGLTYHVLEWGQGERTILLLHGFLDLAWGWEEVAARLAGRFRVVAPDLRGHGDSDWIGPGGYYHFLDYLADLDDLVARLAARHLTVVGHSMGGSVAGYWAGARPDRLQRLALLEGLGPPEPDEQPGPRIARWIDAWAKARKRAPRRMKDLDEAVRRLRHHDGQLGEAQAMRLAINGTIADASGVRWKHDPLHGTSGPYPFRRDVAIEIWRRITVPVLLVRGSASQFRHADDDHAARVAAFGNARELVLDGAGHMMQRHAPEALAAAIAAFAAEE